MKVKKAPMSKIHGTSYKGVVNTTYGHLVSVLGEPHLRDGDKTQAEWMLEFEDGTIATIHDWKEYDTPVEEVTEWHIGGHELRASWYAQKLLGV